MKDPEKKGGEFIRVYGEYNENKGTISKGPQPNQPT